MLRCGVLVRISDDRSGTARGVERQEQDCRELAARQGWEVAKVYRENDTSAFTRRKVRLPDGTTALRVVRPAFRELLADITSGDITALVAYDLDRVARDPRDLEDLIDAVEGAALPTAAVTGEIDLSTDNGVFMARMMVNVANKSSRDTARRVRRAMRAHAEAGLPSGGSRPFGYLDGGLHLHPTEAAAVRWMHQQIDLGRSFRSLGRTLADYFPHRQWDAERVRSTLTSPRNAGLRAHHGEILGPASWPAIVTPERRQLTLDAIDARQYPSRSVGGPRKYLLTGILTCGRCGGVLRPRRNAEAQRFGCPRAVGGCGGSNLPYAPAEKVVVDLILERLRRDLDVVEDEDDPTEALRVQIASLEEQQEQLGRDLAANPAEALMLRGANRALAEQIDQLRQQIADSRRRTLISDPRKVADDWPDYTPDQKRVVAEVLIDRIEVGPGTGGPRFDPTRLSVVWR